MRRVARKQQQTEYGASNEARQAPVKSNYLFIVAVNGAYIAQIISGQAYNIREAMQLFSRMFPAYTQVGIFKCTLTEAGLMATNFNRKPLTVVEYATCVLGVKPTAQAIFVGTASDIGTPVYMANNEYGIAPVLEKTDNFLGYIVNPDYFNLTYKLFGHGWRPKPAAGINV